MSSSDDSLLRARPDKSRDDERASFRWFRRRKRNKRFERKRVLDVKIRASQRRQNRLRRFSFFLLLLASVLVGLFVAWRGGEELLRRFVYENPAFAIHHLDVQTDGVISLDQLRRWAGVKLEDNLLALDLSRVKRDLELVPAIALVSAERVLPHTLRIRVTEREPMAQVQLPPLPGAGTNREPMTYYLDANGFVMFPLEPFQLAAATWTNSPLPTLTGVPTAELRAGRPIESPHVRAALQLILAFERSSMVGLADLRQIDVSARSILQVTTGQGSEVTFRFTDLDHQLRRWRAVHDYGKKVGKHLAGLDLSVANNVPARWSEVVPSELPQPLKPQRYKKRNV
jgi:hypothetical protein